MHEYDVLRTNYQVGEPFKVRLLADGLVDDKDGFVRDFLRNGEKALRQSFSEDKILRQTLVTIEWMPRRIFDWDGSPIVVWTFGQEWDESHLACAVIEMQDNGIVPNEAYLHQVDEEKAVQQVKGLGDTRFEVEIFSWDRLPDGILVVM